MNFDANTITMLMQLLNTKQPSANADLNASNAQKPSNTHCDAKSHVQNAFYAQNGIGERVYLSQNDGRPPSDVADSAQNPIFSLLKSIQGGNGDASSSMLPMLMSLMQKQPSKNTKAQARATDEKREEVKNDSDKPCNDDTSENGKNAQNKTQRDPFAPVAFAGYEVISTLATLITSLRRLYK